MVNCTCYIHMNQDGNILRDLTTLWFCTFKLGQSHDKKQRENSTGT